MLCVAPLKHVTPLPLQLLENVKGGATRISKHGPKNARGLNNVTDAPLVLVSVT